MVTLVHDDDVRGSAVGLRCDAVRLDLNPKPFRRVQSLLDLLAGVGQPDDPAPAVSLLERSRGDDGLARSRRRDNERSGALHAKIYCADLVWSKVHL